MLPVPAPPSAGAGRDASTAIARRTLAAAPAPRHEQFPAPPDRPVRRVSDPRQALVFAVDSLAALVAAAMCGCGPGGFLAFVVSICAVNLARRRRLLPSAWDEAPGLAVRAVVIAVVCDAIGLSVHSGRIGPLSTALWYLALAVLGRAVIYAVLRRLLRRRRLAFPTLIVGTGAIGTQLATVLKDRPEYGLDVVGFVESLEPADRDHLPAPVLGGVGDLPELVAAYRVHHVVVAFCQMRDADLVEVLRAVDGAHCVSVVPRLYELGAEAGYGDQVWGIPLVPLRRAPHHSPMWMLKRAVDVVLAGAALVAVAPLLLAIAVVVRREVGPGVLFRQTRVGIGGRTFELLKFRTLKTGGPDDQAWSTVDPGRVGPIGRFLRRSSLDELPQLWNVLRGQMSLVGPRPEQPRFVEQFSRHYRGYQARLRVPAGLTGWAQVHDLRGASSIEDRVRFDNAYIDEWSLWRDARIMVATVASVLGMRGS